MKYSQDNKVFFDPINHKYFKGEKELTSVTTYISKYKKPFQKDLIAKNYAIKNGLEVSDVLFQWETESNRSKIHGTACHDLMENYVKTGKIIYNGISPKELVGVKFITEIFMCKKLIPIDAECIVYNDILAGQIDCIVYNPERGEYYILDWKTNKKIEKESKFQSNMLSPYQNLLDLNFYHYSLQLNIYKELYKDHKISSCFIVHFEEDSYKIYKTMDIDLQIQF